MNLQNFVALLYAAILKDSSFFQGMEVRVGFVNVA